MATKLNTLLADYETQINTINSPSPSLISIWPAGIPMPGGLAPGATFYLSESQAQAASGNVCHEAYYMFVKVDSGATAANVAAGLIGQRLNVGDGTDASTWTYTDADHGVALLPVVFLNTITPGNYGIVQVSGVATAVSSAAITAGARVAYAAATGKIAANASYVTDLDVGFALTAYSGAGSGTIVFQPLAGACA